MATIKSDVLSVNNSDADNALTNSFQPVKLLKPVKTIILDHGGTATEGNLELSLDGVHRNFSCYPGCIKAIDLPFSTNTIYLRHSGTAVTIWELGSLEA